MGTILKNIVQFEGLVIGVPTALPHRLNVNGRPVTPKIGGGDQSGFDITADDTDVIVTRTGSNADVNVYVEYWHTIESVTPLIPPPGKLIGLVPLFFASGGGGGAASQLLSIYGDGSFGDYTTAGDETWTTDQALPPPGAPTLPAGAPIASAFFDNLTISDGDSVTVGGLSDQVGQYAVVIFVRDTLTIGAGSNINVNGGNGGGTLSTGLGRRAILGSTDGADGGVGRPPFDPGAGNPGGSSTDRPARSSALRVGGDGGNGGIGGAQPGGAGGVDLTPSSWPYSLAQAISIGSLLYKIGGGNGGGGGANSASSGGGSGGGGAGTLVIFARNIVFTDPGCLRAIGGTGSAGQTFENVPGGGGGGGTGGTILVVTENTTLLGIADVSGGPGGVGGGVPQFNGGDGGPGEAIAFNPMLAAQIPT